MKGKSVCIDETMKFSKITDLKKGTDGTVLEIECPCGYHMNIKGKKNDFRLRLGNKDGTELSKDTKIYIFKKEISEEQRILVAALYEQINIPFMFDIILEERDSIIVNVKNPDIDINNVNFTLSVNLLKLIKWEK